LDEKHVQSISNAYPALGYRPFHPVKKMVVERVKKVAWKMPRYIAPEFDSAP
jgi:hypothetical protein